MIDDDGCILLLYFLMIHSFHSLILVRMHPTLLPRGFFLEQKSSESRLHNLKSKVKDRASHVFIYQNCQRRANCGVI